jgi:PBSX family phage terminase large subunit
MVSSRSLTLRVRAHVGQGAVLRSKRFCTAAIAGTGGGKTVVGYVWLLISMIQRPGMVWVVAEPTQPMVQRVLLTSAGDRPTLPDFLARFDPDQVFLRSKGILRHRLGTVILASAENPMSLQGAHVGGVWLDEAGLMGLEAFLVALQRVGYAEGKLLLTTTPYNMGWLKTKVYDRWKQGDPDYGVVQFASTANPRYPKAAVERARKVMSPSRFAMLYEGQFGRPEGMIYDVFDAQRHLVDDFDIPESWERYAGLDFGYNNPTAAPFLARNDDGVYFWFAEHYRRERTLAQHAVELVGKGGKDVVYYADPAGKQEIAELRRRGLSVRGADNSVVAGIDTVYELFATDRLKIFRSCQFGIDELEGYVWKGAKDGEGFQDEPVKDRDHLMDGLRYVLHALESRPGLRLST